MGSSNSKPVEQQTPNANAELAEPWRRFDWGQKKALKEKLENFSPSHPDVKDIKIIVAGEIGAGKSSFINSISSAFQGWISSRAIADASGADNSHSFTQRITGFTIKSGKKSLPFVFKDIMGLEPDVLAGSQPDDIISAVFGHVKDGYKFNPEQVVLHTDQHYISDPKLHDQCFCLVYVIAADTVQFIDDRLFDKLKIIRQRISNSGIPQVIVMTKVDKACPLVKNDLRKIYTSKKIKEKMEMCSLKVGVPVTNIFPVKNYHEEMDTVDDIDVLILKALERIVHCANDRLEDSENY